MAHIEALKGMVFDTAKAGSIESLIAPPYDVIPVPQRAKFYERNPHNILNLDLRPDVDGEDKYAKAADLLHQWEADGIVKLDEEPAIYVLEHTFKGRDAVERTRIGFLSLLSLEPFYTGCVFPHEKTFPSQKEDRYRLLKATNAVFNPVFGLVTDEEKSIYGSLKAAASGAPAVDVTDDSGLRTRMWRMADPVWIAALKNRMKNKNVFIADGHHRYETALRFQAENKEKGAGPWDYMLLFFVSMEDPGLEALPTHRVMKDAPGLTAEKVLETVKKCFSVEKTEYAKTVDSLTPGLGNFMLQLGNEFYEMKLLPTVNREAEMPGLSAHLRALDVSLLHSMVIDSLLGDVKEHFDHIIYEKDPDNAKKAVEAGESRVAFYLPSTPVGQMIEIATAQETMPHKSTFFSPKPVSGIVSYRYPKGA